jgi:TolA-binding protein
MSMMRTFSRYLCAATVVFVCAGPLAAQEPSKEEEALFVAKKAFSDGFYDVAQGLLERLIKAYPSSTHVSEAQLLIGQCLYYQNKYLDSLGKFEALAQDPGARGIQDAVAYWTAEVHFKGNNFSRAADYYRKVITTYPKSSYVQSAYYSLGWCLFQTGEFAQAMKNFTEVVERYPREQAAQDAALKIVECLYNLKDYARLKDYLRQAFAAAGKDDAKRTLLLFYQAEADFYLNNYQDAVAAYRNVIAANTDARLRNLSRLGVGWACIKQKQFKDAQDSFTEVNADALDSGGKEALALGKSIVSFENGKFAEAKEGYGQLAGASNDPAVLAQAYLGMADAAYAMSDYKEAVAVYTRALEKLKNSSAPAEHLDKLYYGLAWAYLKQGEFKSAIDAFQRIARTSEDKVVKVAALCQIGDAYQDAGDYARAVEAYNQILRDYPDSFYGDYVQYQLGLTFLKSSQYDAAILALQKMKEQYPTSKLADDAMYAFGLAYFQREDYRASLEVFRTFQTEFKDSNLRAQALYLMGTCLYNMGDFAGAIDIFKDVMRQFGSDAELVQKAEFEIADCYSRTGNEKEALARFSQLRSKYPDSLLTVEVLWWLGEYHYRHRDFTMAKRYFQSLIQDYPKSALVPDAYYALGSILFEGGGYEEAVGFFRKVIETGKADMAGLAAVAVADIFARQEQRDQAIASYRKALDTYPNLAGAIYPKLAEVYRRANDNDRALECYRSALNVVPVREMNVIQFKIAEILQAQEKIAEAMEAYLKVSYLYSENNDLAVKALLRVAALYEQRANIKEALNVYRRVAAMEAGEESVFAQQRIEQLKGKGR